MAIAAHLSILCLILAVSVSSRKEDFSTENTHNSLIKNMIVASNFPILPKELTYFIYGDKKIRVWESTTNDLNTPPSQWQFMYEPLCIPVADENNRIIVDVEDYGENWTSSFDVILDDEQAQNLAFLSVQLALRNSPTPIPKNVFSFPLSSFTLEMPDVTDRFPGVQLVSEVPCSENLACFTFEGISSSFRVVISSPTFEITQEIAENLRESQLSFEIKSFMDRTEAFGNAKSKTVKMEKKMESLRNSETLPRITEKNTFSSLHSSHGVVQYIFPDDLNRLFYAYKDVTARCHKTNYLLGERYNQWTTVSSKDFRGTNWSSIYLGDSYRPAVLTTKLNEMFSFVLENGIFVYNPDTGYDLFEGRLDGMKYFSRKELKNFLDQNSIHVSIKSDKIDAESVDFLKINWNDGRSSNSGKPEYCFHAAAVSSKNVDSVSEKLEFLTVNLQDLSNVVTASGCFSNCGAPGHSPPIPNGADASAPISTGAVQNFVNRIDGVESSIQDAFFKINGLLEKLDIPTDPVKNPLLGISEDLEDGCQPSWRQDCDPTGCFCYRVFFNLTNWQAAENNCKSFGANLVSIHNLHQQKFTKKLIQEAAGRGTWIGINDIQIEGEFEWSDGSPISFTSWSKRQPDNYKSENCGCMMRNHNYNWNDCKCNVSTMISICKKPEDLNRQRIRKTILIEDTKLNVDDAIGPIDMHQSVMHRIDGVTSALNKAVHKINSISEKIGQTDKTVTAANGGPSNISLNVNALSLVMATSFRDLEKKIANLGGKLTSRLAPLINITRSLGIQTDAAENQRFEKSENLEYGCPPLWEHKCDPSGCFCYRLFSTLTDWHTAEKNCKNVGANLVSIHNLHQQNFIQKLVEEVKGHGAWIGINDIKVEGKFEWSDGSSLNFTYWAPRKPENYKNAGCGSLWKNYSYQWNDDQCSVSRHTMMYICKKKADANLQGIRGQNILKGMTILDKVVLVEVGKISNKIRSLDKSISKDIQKLAKIMEAASKNLSCRTENLDSTNKQVSKVSSVLKPTIIPAVKPSVTEEPIVKKDCNDSWTKACRSDVCHCYRVFPSRTSWMAAEKKCKSFGANLASIHDRAEAITIKKLVAVAGRTIEDWHGYIWIGLNDQTLEGKFEWSDGTPTDYLAWKSTLPDNSHGVEDCAHIVPRLRGDLYYLWSVSDCKASLRSICKKNIQ